MCLNFRKEKNGCVVGCVRAEWPLENFGNKNGILKGEECVLKSFGTKERFLWF